jgi:quercetin dioxygenase-like cupin family protein
MEHMHYSKFPHQEVSAYGSQGTKMCWFRNAGDATHFMLRRFEIGAHGHIGLHQHPEEHQIFILTGPIVLIDEKNVEIVVDTGEFVYCPPNEPHAYRNPNSFPVAFLCGIPKLVK